MFMRETILAHLRKIKGSPFAIFLWPLVITTISALLFSGSGRAQSGYSLNILSTDADQFPAIELELEITDTRGFPVTDITSSHLSLIEDGVPISDFTLEKFQNNSHPIAIVIGIDTSGSMGGVEPNPLDNAVEAAKSFIQSLSPSDVIAIAAFSDEVTIVQDFTSNQNLLFEALDMLEASGATAIYDTIFEAVSALRTRPEEKVLLLLTDGEDSGEGQFDFATAVDAASRENIPIYPVGFGNVQEDELTQIANLTDGLLQIEPDSTTLNSAFQNVLDSLKTRYRLQYQTQLEADSEGHELSMRILYQSRDFSASTTVFAIAPLELSISAPSEEEVVLGEIITIEANVEGRGIVEQVSFYLDDQLLAHDSEPPYQADWDTSNLTVGDYAIQVVAVDANGFTVEDELAIHGVVSPNSSGLLFVALGVAVVTLVVIPVAMRSRRNSAVLIESEGVNPGKVWRLGGKKVSLGRKEKENTIHLLGLSASRFQAEITASSEGHTIRSIKADNLVKRNGKSVEDSVILENGDSIEMGESVFQYKRKK
jgi:VWFA-related protein